MLENFLIAFWTALGRCYRCKLLFTECKCPPENTEQEVEVIEEIIPE